MNRYEQWDIVSGVGITALAVAAGRAVETHRADALIGDPYAEDFVIAARPPIPMPIGDAGHDGAELAAAGDELDTDLQQVWEHAANHMGVRSRFFDDFFRDACRDGVTQAVILAAGLDSRAFRLHWPSGMRVFELDQPKVLEFKDEVLTNRGATPSCQRRVVPIDLREAWSAALEGGGFDPNAPTAWLAEGLLPYLPAGAQDDLLRTVSDLSAPGSRIAIEHLRNITMMRDDPEIRQMSSRYGIDFAALIPDSAGAEAPAPEEWLRARKWDVDSAGADAIAERYGRNFEPFFQAMDPNDYRFVTARLP